MTAFHRVGLNVTFQTQSRQQYDQQSTWLGYTQYCYSWWTLLSSLLSSQIHPAQRVPPSQELCPPGSFVWTRASLSLGQGDTAQSDPGNEACVYLTWSESPEKTVQMQDSRETPEQFQAYKYVTLKTWFVSFLEISQNLMCQWVKE